jgi:hypothetical protein
MSYATGDNSFMSQYLFIYLFIYLYTFIADSADYVNKLWNKNNFYMEINLRM